MKLIVLLLVMGLGPWARGSGEKIEKVSNLSTHGVVVSLLSADEKQPRKLVWIDPRVQLSQSLPWPKEIGSEKVKALILIGDRLILISQWTMGGGQFPHLHFLNLKKSVWDPEVRELKCVSFDQITLRNGQLQVPCEEDPLHGQKAQRASVKLAIDQKVNWERKLPILRDSSEGLQFELLQHQEGGWQSIRVEAGAGTQKTQTATQLVHVH